MSLPCLSDLHRHLDGSLREVTLRELAAVLTGLPAAPFVILGVLIFCIGVISLLSLFPLAGLDPRDNRALFVIPAALFLISVLSFVVAQCFVPGSPIDREYALGPDILLTATFSILLYPIVGLILAVLYVTLIRKISPDYLLGCVPRPLTWHGKIFASPVSCGLSAWPLG